MDFPYTMHFQSFIFVAISIMACDPVFGRKPSIIVSGKDVHKMAYVVVPSDNTTVFAFKDAMTPSNNSADTVVDDYLKRVLYTGYKQGLQFLNATKNFIPHSESPKEGGPTMATHVKTIWWIVALFVALIVMTGVLFAGYYSLKNYRQFLIYRQLGARPNTDGIDHELLPDDDSL